MFCAKLKGLCSTCWPRRSLPGIHHLSDAAWLLHRFARTSPALPEDSQSFIYHIHMATLCSNKLTSSGHHLFFAHPHLAQRPTACRTAPRTGCPAGLPAITRPLSGISVYNRHLTSAELWHRVSAPHRFSQLPEIRQGGEKSTLLQPVPLEGKSPSRLSHKLRGIPSVFCHS